MEWKNMCLNEQMKNEEIQRKYLIPDGQKSIQRMKIVLKI